MTRILVPSSLQKHRLESFPNAERSSIARSREGLVLKFGRIVSPKCPTYTLTGGMLMWVAVISSMYWNIIAQMNAHFTKSQRTSLQTRESLYELKYCRSIGFLHVVEKFSMVLNSVNLHFHAIRDQVHRKIILFQKR